MELDDEVCLCYHVTLRKLLNYARRTRPRHASQMSECLGAGTGCGWCVSTLTRIAECAERGSPLDLPIRPEEYASARRDYHKKIKWSESGAGAGRADSDA